MFHLSFRHTGTPDKRYHSGMEAHSLYQQHDNTWTPQSPLSPLLPLLMMQLVLQPPPPLLLLIFCWGVYSRRRWSTSLAWQRSGLT